MQASKARPKVKISVDAEDFRRVMSIFAAHKTVMLKVDKLQVEARAIDPTRAAMSGITLPADSFSTYKLSEDVEWQIPLESLRTVLSQIHEDDTLTLSGSSRDMSLSISLQDGEAYGRHTSISLLPPLPNTPPWPRSDAYIRLVTSPALFGSLLHSAEALAGTMEFRLALDTLEVHFDNPRGLPIQFRYEPTAFSEYTAEFEARVSYGASYIATLAEVCRIAEAITLKFTRRCLLHVHMSLQDGAGEVQMYLAPRLSMGESPILGAR